MPPHLAGAGAVVGVQQVVPHIGPQAIGQRIAGVVNPALIEISMKAGRVSYPDQLRNKVGQKLKFFLFFLRRIRQGI
nr:hypothetical protein [Hymenobacter sp. BRD67]